MKETETSKYIPLLAMTFSLAEDHHVTLGKFAEANDLKPTTLSNYLVRSALFESSVKGVTYVGKDASTAAIEKAIVDGRRLFSEHQADQRRAKRSRGEKTVTPLDTNGKCTGVERDTTARLVRIESMLMKICYELNINK